MQSLSETIKPYPVLTVSELTARIRHTIEEQFDFVAVTGEISNAKLYPSGHWYFSLKDKEATLPCVCFKNSSASLKFALEDGLMVVARGKLSVYPPRGAYQMIVTSLEPVGVGEWQLAFEQLRKKLEQEGLLDVSRRRPIPILPKRVGVVTSPVGAAIKDILSAIARRNRGVNVLISPCKVQGEGSAEDIARAIAELQDFKDLDVIIVARGGGSIEDLWSFNTEVVARAVAESKIPVVSGVGHEVDVTICDLVADLRAPTPTAAAELVARGRDELTERWRQLTQRMLARIEHRLADVARILERLNPRHALYRYQERLKQQGLRILHQNEVLRQRITALLKGKSSRWREQNHKLVALGPLNVLSRGFAIVRDRDGHVITDAAEVSPGQILEALLHSGKIIVRVESSEGHWYSSKSEGNVHE